MRAGLTVAALLAFTGVGIWFDWSLWFTVPPFVLALVRALDS